MTRSICLEFAHKYCHALLSGEEYIVAAKIIKSYLKLYLLSAGERPRPLPQALL